MLGQLYFRGARFTWLDINTVRLGAYVLQEALAKVAA